MPAPEGKPLLDIARLILHDIYLRSLKKEPGGGGGGTPFFELLDVGGRVLGTPQFFKPIIESDITLNMLL